MRSLLVLTIVAIVVVALRPPVRAAKQMAVLSTESASPGNGAVQAKIVRALKQKKIRVVPRALVRKFVKKTGVPGSDADWASLAHALKVDGIVGYAVAGTGANRKVDLVLRNGSDGSVAGDDSTTTRALAKRVGPFIAASLKNAGSATDAEIGEKTPEEASDGLGPAAPEKVPPPIEDKQVPPRATTVIAAEEAAPADARPSGPAVRAEQAETGHGVAVVVKRPLFAGAVGKLSVYEIELDARALRRTFGYSPGSIPQGYTLNFNPMVGGRASWFPLQRAGVFVQGEFGAGLETGSYPTGTREVQGGAQVRIPLAFGQVGASASYFNHAFLIQDTSAANDASRLTLPIPNTVYQGVRLGAGARYKIARNVQVAANVAYRLVASVGQDPGQVKSSAYFPMSSNPWGLDGSAYVGVGLGAVFEVRAGVDYRRYTYGHLRGTTLGGTTIDASAAVDQYVAAVLGLAVVLDKGPPSSE